MFIAGAAKPADPSSDLVSVRRVVTYFRGMAGSGSMHTGVPSTKPPRLTKGFGILSASAIGPEGNHMRLFVFTLMFVVGCTTSLIPGADEVNVTRDQSHVTDCESLGFVEARPPFSTPNDARNEMRNKTAILGGNVCS